MVSRHPLCHQHTYDNDISSLENEISQFSNKGKIILMGDLNSRTADKPDFIVNDSSEINHFDGLDLLPENYKSDTELHRINQEIIY